MAYEHKPGSFSLFKNEKKTAENHPDYRGEGVDIGGTAIEVAAWLKTSAKGKFMSCTFKPKQEREKKPASFPDDDVAF